MTITELDTVRADTMRRLLTDEGRRHIWKYDIVEKRIALAIAREDYDFDNMDAGLKAAGKSFALIGPGIVDSYFETPAELETLLLWLCVAGGDLSPYAAATETGQGVTSGQKTSSARLDAPDPSQRANVRS